MSEEEGGSAVGKLGFLRVSFRSNDFAVASRLYRSSGAQNIILSTGFRTARCPANGILDVGSISRYIKSTLT